jgi:hypothetical protein
MGGTPHWCRGHLLWLQATARTSAAERKRCAAIVDRWNAAPTHDWSPAMGTALKAGCRWLDVYCGGCRQMKPIDLAAVNIHPHPAVSAVHVGAQPDSAASCYGWLFLITRAPLHNDFWNLRRSFSWNPVLMPVAATDAESAAGGHPVWKR